jgi:hypothetical protein
MRDGERDLTSLSQGIDSIETIIVTRALDSLAGRVSLASVAEPLRPTVNLVVRAGIRRREQKALDVAAEEELATLGAALDEMDKSHDWAMLSLQLRRVAAGETRLEWEGLDEIDTVLLATVWARVNEATYPGEHERSRRS